MLNFTSQEPWSSDEPCDEKQHQRPSPRLKPVLRNIFQIFYIYLFIYLAQAFIQSEAVEGEGPFSRACRWQIGSPGIQTNNHMSITSEVQFSEFMKTFSVHTKKPSIL